MSIRCSRSADDIDFGPVGRGVGLEDAHDLLDGTESVLTGHGWNDGFAAVSVLGMIHVRLFLGKDHRTSGKDGAGPIIRSRARAR